MELVSQIISDDYLEAVSPHFKPIYHQKPITYFQARLVRDLLFGRDGGALAPAKFGQVPGDILPLPLQLLQRLHLAVGEARAPRLNPPKSLGRPPKSSQRA